MTIGKDQTPTAATARLVKEALAGFTASAMAFGPTIGDPELDQSPQPLTFKATQYKIFSSDQPVSTYLQRQPTSASPSYLAAKRRAQSRRIANSISALGKWKDEPEFVVWTQEPLSLLRTTIKFFDDAEQFAEVEYEGNSCEVFRQIRDTFHKRGWERYRDDSVRQLVGRILDRLALDDVVTSDFANSTIDQLLDMNLQPIAWEPMQNVDSEEEDDC